VQIPGLILSFGIHMSCDSAALTIWLQIPLLILNTLRRDVTVDLASKWYFFVNRPPIWRFFYRLRLSCVIINF